MAGGPEVVVYVGSRIQGNVLGLTEFIEDAWPRIRQRRPEARLRIYGDIVTRLEAGGAGIEPIGYVRRLEPVYRQATVLVNPVRLGTGLKIKTVEALAHGRAMVTTPAGAEGLPGASGSALLVADSMPDFADAVVRLLEDPTLRRSLERAGSEYARTHFSPTAAIRELVEEIRESLKFEVGSPKGRG